ncbi:1-acyl-sn-glycerol-3-phosphate acyltransferase [Novimethylophilus kurashikiensis]|uniref:1-acyl-sn-glycerol-3-phosphate acyltransferase n=1 Tax=Novimethylophilus kurashikiensis TaxID=1825523 RepID=A0A2R5FH96_9PROT|nr:lysophospholipid acyltransferase family protein [Novimethylophilus kurashikiensis]GBG15464.1 1-acyl-sn-glycerol-3-phosphate acyltransferase [Novimethylophilus kurashikiensis]
MAHLFLGMAIAATLLPRLSPDRRRRLIRWWSGRVLRILNVRLQIKGERPTENLSGVLFVSNHISWLDIWLINAVQPVRFISKSEVRTWPLVGWLAEKVGTLFIERARRRDTSRISNAGTSALQQGDCLCVFPEGTTTDGTCMRPFKSSLLQSAVDSGTAVWPMVVAYPGKNGCPDTGIAYADDISMTQSMREILGRRSIDAVLEFLPPLPSQGLSRRQLSAQAEKVISSAACLGVRAAPGTASGLPAAGR